MCAPPLQQLYALMRRSGLATARLCLRSSNKLMNSVSHSNAVEDTHKGLGSAAGAAQRARRLIQQPSSPISVPRSATLQTESLIIWVNQPQNRNKVSKIIKRPGHFDTL
jgi:hypothetical protein